MSKDSFTGRTKAERRSFLSNFVPKLADTTNGYATKYGVSAGTITALTEGRQWVEWTFNNLVGLRDKSQSLTLFQDQLMNGKGATGNLPLPTAPTFTAMPLDGSTPITPVANVIGLAASVGKAIKVHKNYSPVDGEDLGLEGPEQPDLPPVESTAPDLSKTRLGSGGQVEVVWPKGPFDAIRIEVDRSNGGTAGFSLLAVDTEPNYIDTVTPPAGTVTVYRYRAIYILSDQPYGQWSQTVEVTVRG